MTNIILGVIIIILNGKLFKYFYKESVAFRIVVLDEYIKLIVHSLKAPTQSLPLLCAPQTPYLYFSYGAILCIVQKVRPSPHEC